MSIEQIMILIICMFNCVAVTLMLIIYHSMEESLASIQQLIFDFHIRLLGRDNGCRVQGVAKNTEVAE